MKIIIDTKIFGHDTDKALVMVNRCTNMKISDIPEDVKLHITFRNVGEIYSPQNTVQIFSLGVEPARSGYGSKIMREICRIADEEKINLILLPSYTCREELVKFYSRFDFVPDGTDMKRLYKRNYMVLKDALFPKAFDKIAKLFSKE